MPLKKQTFNADEIEIYDEAVVYKRGDYWQMRMWLAKEKKYARFSLRTRNRDTAIDKAKKYYHPSSTESARFQWLLNFGVVINHRVA